MPFPFPQPEPAAKNVCEYLLRANTSCMYMYLRLVQESLWESSAAESSSACLHLPSAGLEYSVLATVALVMHS